MLTVVAVAAAAAALLVPSARHATASIPDAELLPHGELGLLAAGTLSGDEPE